MPDDTDIIDEIAKQLRPHHALSMLIGTIDNARLNLMIRQQRGATPTELAGAAAALIADIFQVADAYAEASKFPPAPSE